MAERDFDRIKNRKKCCLSPINPNICLILNLSCTKQRPAKSLILTFFIYFLNRALISMFASWMERLGLFPTSYATTGNQTHVCSVAPLSLRDLNSGHFTNLATADTNFIYNSLVTTALILWLQ